MKASHECISGYVSVFLQMQVKIRKYIQPQVYEYNDKFSRTELKSILVSTISGTSTNTFLVLFSLIRYGTADVPLSLVSVRAPATLMISGQFVTKLWRRVDVIPR